MRQDDNDRHRELPTGVNPFGLAALFGRGRLLLSLTTIAMAVVGYSLVPSQAVTKQQMAQLQVTPQKEMVLGRHSGPFLAVQYGGLLKNQTVQHRIDRIGQTLVQRNFDTTHNNPFNFYVVADTETVNVFALPGGQVYITAGMVDRLVTDEQLAAVLSQALAHISLRHGIAHLSQIELAPGLMATQLLAEVDPLQPDVLSTDLGRRLLQTAIDVSYTDRDVHEADTLAVDYLTTAGYPETGLEDALAAIASDNLPVAYFKTRPYSANVLDQLRGVVR